MLDFFSKALEWLKSPKRWSAVFIVCVALLFLPSTLIQKIGLAEIRQRYLPWISLCAIFSLAVLIVELADWMRTPLKSFREQRDRKAVLRALTPPEAQIITEYFRQQTDTQYFAAEDGLAGGLEAKGLIYRSTSLSRGLTPHFGYNLQPWVRETIRKSPEILQAYAVLSTRKAAKF